MKKNPDRSEAPKKEQTRAMRFQVRDGELLQTIYEHGGVMARRQLMELFWPDRSSRAMEKRLAKLHQRLYIAWPTLGQRRTRPIPEPIVWLGWQGILWIAGQQGISAAVPNGENENQMRKLEKSLREKGIRWLREPRWAQLTHDLKIVDFRLCVEQAVKLNPAITLEEWVNESEFHANPDVVEYEVKTNGHVKRVHKKVIPDGYFAIIDGGHRSKGTSARSRFLLEIDMANHDNPSFGREKVLPGIAYLLSPAYRQRFGDNSGRWLVVTTGERRLSNLKRQAEKVTSGDASSFYFTTFDQIRPETIFSISIWYRGGDEDRHKLFDR